ncbi:MAG: hypothetical protein C5B57_04310 [Blastocatellia bacterium]|nr:MAG: hypothetical protein C5B57_04310 [Blastocatellia bacterium]
MRRAHIMVNRREFLQSGMAAALLSRLGSPSGTVHAGAAGQSRALKVEASMIKVVAPALHHPTNRTLAQFHNYWSESHGPLFANTKNLRRYVQHLTLPEAYDTDPKPTFDGVSMFWYDTYEPPRAPPGRDAETLALLKAVLGVSNLGDDGDAKAQQPASPGERVAMTLLKAVLKDDAQLFDRSTSWPMHHKSASVAAQEHVIVDGPTGPQMVKAIFVASKLPGLTLDQFFDRWQNHHGRLGAKLPGLRRYVQNHAIAEAYVDPGRTHDGWSELWFDDLRSLHAAVNSAEWKALGEDGATLFAAPMGVGVARERVQKELDWSYNDWGVNAMSEEDVRQRLMQQGYATLAADRDAPRKIKTAAGRQALAVWTREHIVTIDESAIDARSRR